MPQRKQPEIEYPVTMALKVIMTTVASDAVNRSRITACLTDLSITPKGWRSKQGRGGNFVSYTVTITVPDEHIFHAIYNSLRSVEGVKYAI